MRTPRGVYSAPEGPYPGPKTPRGDAATPSRCTNPFAGGEDDLDIAYISRPEPPCERELTVLLDVPGHEPRDGALAEPTFRFARPTSSAVAQAHLPAGSGPAGGAETRFADIVDTCHKYRAVTLLRLKYCEVCGTVLWGIRAQGQGCQACGLVVCHDCAANPGDPPCRAAPSRAPLTRPSPGIPPGTPSREAQMKAAAERAKLKSVLLATSQQLGQLDSQAQLDSQGPRAEVEIVAERTSLKNAIANSQHLGHLAPQAPSTKLFGPQGQLKPSKNSNKLTGRGAAPDIQQVDADASDKVFPFLLYSHYIRWLKAEYLRDLHRNGHILRRQQEVPPDAFLSIDELRGKLAAREPSLFVVSHPWLSLSHPDPHGLHLNSLVEFGGPSGGHLPVDAAVFWDFASLPQRPRTESQSVIFEAALASMELLFITPFTQVVRLEHVPPGSERNTAYRDRGWCFLEFRLSAQKGTRSYAIRDPKSDNATCRSGDSAATTLVPCLPRTFKNMLRGMAFSHEEDRNAVGCIYERAFRAHIAQQPHLHFHHLQEDGITQMMESLPDFRELKSLTLTECGLRSEHLPLLRSSLEGLSKLEELVVKQRTPLAGLDPLRQLGVRVQVRTQEDSYHGELRAGIPHGQGKCAYADGDTYEGEWLDGLEHGQGKHFYAGGEVYQGLFRCNRRHGFGRFLYADGALYQGSWDCDKKHGHGQLRFADGATYDGAFQAGQAHGSGRYSFPDGRAYDGQWQGGHMHGHGVFKFSTGEVYDGEWLQDSMQGCGRCTFADGASYQGEFQAGRPQGVGTYNSADGTSYAGQFQDGSMRGQGKYTYRNGATLEGEFNADLPRGLGCGAPTLSSKESIISRSEGVEELSCCEMLASGPGQPVSRRRFLI